MRKIMIVKLVILLVFVLQGVVSGLRFPEEILARGIVTPGGGEGSAHWLNLVFPAFVALVVLAGNTGVYFLGLFVFSISDSPGILPFCIAVSARNSVTNSRESIS